MQGVEAVTNAYDSTRGNVTDRQRRRAWLLETYRADVDLPDMPGVHFPPPDVPVGRGIPACRCYRCGCLLTIETLTVDRIVPGCKGGTYRRTNIRPACSDCNSETGRALRGNV